MRGFGNLGGMGSMGNLMKQAQKAMAQMQQLEQELRDTTVEGTAGGGMVKVEATGAGEIVSFSIDKQVVDPEDVEMLEDLALSAVREALEKAAKMKEERVKQLTQGLPIDPSGLF